MDFENFWFDTATPTVLAEMLKNNHATVEEFRGIKVNQYFIDNPGVFAESELVSYLYQTGYLTLRPAKSDQGYTLDYPNGEVLKAMSNLFVTNILGRDLRVNVNNNLQQALNKNDVEGVIAQFDKLLAKVSYNDYNDVNDVDVKHLTVLDAKGDRYYFNEFFFRCLLRSLLVLAGAKVSADVNGSEDRNDIVFEWNQQNWVIELKVAKEGDNAETELTNAVERIRSQRYAALSEDPICLAIVIDEKTRQVALYNDFTIPKSQTNAKRRKPNLKITKSRKLDPPQMDEPTDENEEDEEFSGGPRFRP
jgi:hypothetical protein